ncbi:MAG: Asp23/Gls24 family envelope stress response protein [Fervidobacterium sp.]
MGYIEIKDTVYQEITFRTICELLGLDKDDKSVKGLKKSITVESVSQEIEQASDASSEIPQLKSIYLLLQLSATFGTDIIEFSNRIACKVKEEVSNKTGTNVLGVNVRIVDIEKSE